MKHYVLIISAVAALGGFLFGFDTAVISGVNPFIREFFDLDEILLGWANSSLILGAILGTLVAGKPGDWLGRRRTLMLTALLFLISALGSALAGSFTEFVIYRMIGGVAVGAASVISPIYIAEVAPAGQRGRLVSLNQLTIVTGIFVSFFSNYLLEQLTQNNWRWMLGVEAIPALLFLLLLVTVPESPRWLIINGQVERARRVLSKWLSEAEVEEEIRDVQSAHSAAVTAGVTVLLKPGYRKLALLGVVLAVFQQFTGINVIMYYAPLIFERAGFGTGSALLQTAAIGVINCVFTILAMRFVDRLGRRPLLIVGAGSMAFFLFTLSLTFFAGRLDGYWVLLFIMGFIASFAASYGPVVWVLISEIFPNNIRGVAVSVATFALWSANFIVTATFPSMLARWDGGYTFLFYAAINVGSLFFVRAFIPETKGKSLEQLESELTA
ncbi:MAG: sugar porter family MFS transporter [Acidobacteriota bacterium]|nr:MAG: sugar porter family MFS transporter [Acidobacteriota bacterium]